MNKKILLIFLLIAAVLAQITSIPSIDSVMRPTPSIRPSMPVGGSSSGANSPSSNDVDIDASQASSLISSLFGNNAAAAQSLQRSASPAPTSAPAGATLSASAPSESQRLSASPSANMAGLSVYPGYPGGGWNNWGNWGRWVQVLRCNFNWDGSFCCRYVWVWRYW